MVRVLNTKQFHIHIIRMTDIFAEISESDTQTFYPLTNRFVDCKTRFCESVVIGESPSYGRVLFLDGEIQSAEADEWLYHEALVHPVMSGLETVGADRRVLVVGGGEGATVREVLKWAPLRVDWIDIDGELVELCKKHLNWAPNVYAHPSVHYQAEDIRVALPNLGLYDVIILDLPDPDGNTGYLYSSEFWRDIKTHMKPVTGRIVTHCGPVRPFGTIGEGFQRVVSGLCEDGVSLSRLLFYTQTIPSFQGEWGFLLYAPDSNFIGTQRPPRDLRSVDAEQLTAWFQGNRKWWNALKAVGW